MDKTFFFFCKLACFSKNLSIVFNVINVAVLKSRKGLSKKPHLLRTYFYRNSRFFFKNLTLPFDVKNKASLSSEFSYFKSIQY